MKTLYQSYYFLSTVFMLSVALGGNAYAEKSSFIGLYGGWATSSNISEIFLFDATFVDSYMATLFYGRELARYGDIIDTELEGQVVKHWGDQDHWEFNGSLNLRWQPFIWDNIIDTSLAVGIGLSYATEEPVIEIEKNDETGKLLAYFMMELDFTLPRQENWSIIARLHHRSGAWGLFDGIHGGSNILCAGIKYTFD